MALKPDELLVGSGDGNVCLVLDKSTRQGRKKPPQDGVPKQVSEPTNPCLMEVRNINKSTNCKRNLTIKKLVKSQMKCKGFPGAVTSISRKNLRTVLIGCDSGDIFELDTLTFDSALLSSCHTGPILDIAFPRYNNNFPEFSVKMRRSGLI